LISFISICVGSVLLPSLLLILAHDQTGDSWDLTNSQIAMIGSIVFGGEIVGNLFWGPFADKYGRRLAFILGILYLFLFSHSLGSLLIVVGGFLTVIAPNYALMVTFRGIVGFGVGGCTVPFDLLAEFLPNSHRGQFLMYIEYFWTLGCMFVVGFAWCVLVLILAVHISFRIFLPSYGWRVLTLVSAIPVAIALVLAMIFLPESPRWLLSVNRKEEAVGIITKAAKFNGTPLEKFTLYSLQEERALGRSTSSEGSASNVEKTFLEFFQEKENLKISFPLWIVWGCFGLSYYGIILLTTAVYANDEDDDDSAGDDDDSNGSCSFQYQNIFLSACVESIGIVLATLLIDSWGRVPTQGLFNSICGVGVLFMSAGSWFQGTKTRNGMLLFFSFLARIGAMAAG
jgi:MFS family permease